MTVSRVVKNSGYVSSDTRKRVEAAIEELDYRPNEIARSLLRSRTNNIFLIVPDIENPFFPEMIKGTETVLRRHGFTSIFADTDGKIDVEEQMCDRALSRIVDGIILYTPRSGTSYLESLGSRVPLVVVDRRVTSESVDYIYLDNKPSAQKAVEYLIENGHRTIGLIGGPDNVLANLRRKSGYTAALKKHDIAIRDDLMLSTGFSFEDGAAAFRYFWAHAERPTAYFATNDVMALGFIQEAQEQGASVPADFSIVGFDNIAVSRLISPPLTTVNNPRHRMGALAAYRLLARLGEAVEIPKYELSSNLIVRGSVRPIHQRE